MDNPFIFRQTLPIQPNAKPAKKAKKKVQKPLKKTSKKKQKMLYNPHLSGPSYFNTPHFAILPATAFPHPRVAFMLSFFTTNLEQQAKMLKIFNQNTLKSQSDEKENPYESFFWNAKLITEVKKAIQKTKRIRAILRIFLHIWRFKRLQSANDEDPVLLEVPQTPVWIVDWKLRRKYMFHPRSLSKDITERLLTHDGFFDDAQAPRNPFTNLPLTQAQMISVWNQISESPVATSSAFAEFRRARFCMIRYQTENLLSLQLHAFRSTMKNPHDIDTQERVLDFITYSYDQEALDPPDGLYVFLFKCYTNHKILQEWIRICQEFYEISMIYFKNTAKVHQIQDSILNKTVPLIQKDSELQILRRQHIRLTTRQRQASSNEAQ